MARDYSKGMVVRSSKGRQWTLTEQRPSGAWGTTTGGVLFERELDNMEVVYSPVVADVAAAAASKAEVDAIRATDWGKNWTDRTARIAFGDEDDDF
jgi:hypothetical protein